MRELRFPGNYWQSLAPLSFRLRGLYTVLCCSADHAGVVIWSAAKIEEDAGGKGFGMADIEGLGDRVRWLDGPGGNKPLLLVDYLAGQCKTLSRACRGQAPVWRSVDLHWPDGIEAAWSGLGISDRLPPIKK